MASTVQSGEVQMMPTAVAQKHISTAVPSLPNTDNLLSYLNSKDKTLFYIFHILKGLQWLSHACKSFTMLYWMIDDPWTTLVSTDHHSDYRVLVKCEKYISNQ